MYVDSISNMWVGPSTLAHFYKCINIYNTYIYIQMQHLDEENDEPRQQPMSDFTLHCIDDFQGFPTSQVGYSWIFFCWVKHIRGYSGRKTGYMIIHIHNLMFLIKRTHIKKGDDRGIQHFQTHLQPFLIPNQLVLYPCLYPDISRAWSKKRLEPGTKEPPTYARIMANFA